MKSIKISFLGLGVVGSKLMEYVMDSPHEINSCLGGQINIDKVFVRDIKKKRSVDVSNLSLTDDPYDAIRHADIIIDCMGGNRVELTRTLILKSIKENKAIIMSSKKCLALYGKEISSAVRKNNTCFHYDAAVGGCIPISSAFEHMGKCERIDKIYGICNATSNYILEEMQLSGSSYQTALRKAGEKGFTENDPDEDVNGFDALYKSVILMGFGMGYWMDCDKIMPNSIKNITPKDMVNAIKKKCVLKPLFSIEHINDTYSCFIGPQAVPNDSILASIKGNTNIIIICGTESGERAFVGQGAGAKPTASAMFDDLVKTVKELKTKAYL